MNRSMITATNTMTQLQKKLDLISNNISNIDTAGYKKREANFGELLAQQFNNQPVAKAEEGMRLTPNGIRLGTGAKLADTSIIMSQGSLKQTERPLDLAFTSPGQFLQVLANNETHYTRNGALYLSQLEEGSQQSMLVTGDGHPILDENGNTIVINGDIQQINIEKTGTLTITDSNNNSETWNLGVVNIDRPNMMTAVGSNIFAAPADTAGIITNMNREDIRLQQGALEQSNVDLTKEMTDMLTTQRSYQFNAKSISIADQMMGLINGIR
ncbi:flagellar hook-basal body protein [Bacillus sp. HMF5848]|uniref:flagellar hook-basal body protein n=1 Tax=Bacillus sp. HMF5848 TaxID=2495421 RepID=UPI000F7A720B|nr:flagellar hook-basal body protein [Bacillus sp. HMF5848]RSK29459.1 flagellar hook-basal body protein [Bacillus sp. HMF5848]